MPVFEYKCNVCSEEFEKLVLKRDAEIECPKCGTKDVKKKFSVFGMSGVENPSSGCTSCSGSSCSTCK